MAYILNESYALRGYRNTPVLLYDGKRRQFRKLTTAEALFLRFCDGQRDAELPDDCARFLDEGVIRQVNRGEAALTEWQKLRLFDNPCFRMMMVSITDRCNFNCRHCFNAADEHAQTAQMSLEDARRLISEAADCGVMEAWITGGEPMLHPDFPDILRAFSEKHIQVTNLITNGSFLTEETLAAIRSMGQSPLFEISFDGVGTHDWMRGRQGAEEQAIRSIRLCKKHGFRVMAQMNVNRKTQAAVFPTLRFLDELGADIIRLIRTSESPRWVKCKPEGTLRLEEYYELMNRVCAEYAAGQYRASLILWQFAELHPKRKEIILIPVLCPAEAYRDAIPSCKRNASMVTVDADGSVFPCMQFSGWSRAHKLSLGNALADGLQSVLNREDFLRFAKLPVGAVREHDEKCASCRFFKQCGGGCRALATAFTGDSYARDPSKCVFFEQGWYEKTLSVMPGWKPAAELKNT